MENKTDNNLRQTQTKFNKEQRGKQKNQKPAVIWLTGISGSGKSTLAIALDQYLTTNDFHSFVLDGDNLRSGINNDLDFSDQGRHENIRRVGEIAKLFCDSGLVTVVALISPFRADRETARRIIGSDSFYEIFIKASLETCEKRDTKGFYKRARGGEIPNFTGLDSMYEEPQQAELVVETDDDSPQKSSEYIIAYLKQQGLLSHRP